MSRPGHSSGDPFGAHGQHEDGFSLLETLIALTILALSVAVLFGIFSGAIERSRQDQLAMEARLLAQTLLAEAESAPPLASTQGRDRNGIAWRLQVTRSPDAAQLSAGLLPETVSATVRWISASRERRLTLSTLVIAPQEEKP